MTKKKYLKIGVYGFFPTLSMILFSSIAYAHGGYGRWGMGPGMMGGWGRGWWGFIPMLLFWGVIIAIVVLFVRWLAKGSGKSMSGLSSESRSLETLKERYARGEISQEEFEQMKKVMLT